MFSRNESLPASERHARRAAFASFVGAVVEWYDFLLYGIVAALVFNSQFFPNMNATTGTLAALATFGVGFLFRPLGGLLFGHYGDKLGRKRMLVITVFLMGLSTALIGLLPTYAQIGIWAPVLLVFLRAVQGFAVGGEWGGAALMAVESAPKHRRALYSSGVQMGYGAGLCLATGSVSLLSFALTEEQFMTWGWRIPFVLSVVLVLIAVKLRRSVTESQDLRKAQEADQHKQKLPILQAIQQHPSAFVIITAMRFAELLTMYIVTTFALSYSTQYLNLSRDVFLHIGLLVGGLSCITVPIFAHIADKHGRKRVYLTGSLIGTLAAFPFFYALESGLIIWIILCAVILINVAHDMVVSVQQPIFAELFGVAYRYSGAGVGYQLASVIAGGFTPFIAAFLVESFNGSWMPVAIYLSVGCALSFLAALTMLKQQ